ncbi:MAG: acyl-CoA dehydrogenase family protein [Thermomicrobiales bacterium]
MPGIAWPYSEDIEAIREGLSSFIERVVIPISERKSELLEEGRYTPQGLYKPEVLAIMREVRERSAEAGYYSMCVPEEMGGAGLGYLANFAAWERIFHICGAKYWLAQQVISHWVRGPSPVLRALTPEMLDEVLPGLMSGKLTTCFALSEPEAGSDAAAIKTRAVPHGDGWIVNGAKMWTTNSPYADYAIIFAVTDPELAQARKGGISAFLVPTNTPGFLIQSPIKMWGEAGADEAQIAFEDMRVERRHLIGELHKGFGIAMLGAGLGRMYNCGRAIGLGRWALEMGLEYVKIRKTFGRPLSDNQGLTFPLANAALDLHGAHLISRNAATLLDEGERAQKELAFAKVVAAEAACKAVDTVIQAHGAIGFTNEMHLTHAYSTLRKIRVADGASEIMRRQIVKNLLSGDLAI